MTKMMKKSDEICFENKGHAVTQQFNIKATLRIFSETWLEDLTIKDECVCENEPKPPLELVFVLDGSDSFNTEAQGVDGKIMPEASFEYCSAWIADFLTSAKLNYYPSVVVSAIQFSGNKVHEAGYKPGSGGVASISTTGVKDYHYKEIIPPTEWKSQSLSGRTHWAGKVFGQEQLDGNCQLFLCLQDIALPKFLSSLDAQLAGGKGGEKQKVERALIFISNSNNWDTDKVKLKRWDNNAIITDKTRVAQLVLSKYSKVIPISVQETDVGKPQQRFLDEHLSKPKACAMYTPNRAFSERMQQHKTKILKMLHLD